MRRQLPTLSCRLPRGCQALPSTLHCAQAVESAVETAVENALLDRSFDIRANVRLAVLAG